MAVLNRGGKAKLGRTKVQSELPLLDLLALRKNFKKHEINRQTSYLWLLTRSVFGRAVPPTASPGPALGHRHIASRRPASPRCLAAALGGAAFPTKNTRRDQGLATSTCIEPWVQPRLTRQRGVALQRLRFRQRPRFSPTASAGASVSVIAIRGKHRLERIDLRTASRTP